MPERWVANASPLIVMAKVGLEGWFLAVPDEVVVPRAVAGDILAGPPDDPARRSIAEGRFALVDAPEAPGKLSEWDPGAGETSVLAVALADADYTAALDDAAPVDVRRRYESPLTVP